MGKLSTCYPNGEGVIEKEGGGNDFVMAFLNRFYVN
jgi:hypothetical protein